MKQAAEEAAAQAKADEAAAKVKAEEQRAAAAAAFADKKRREKIDRERAEADAAAAAATPRQAAGSSRASNARSQSAAPAATAPRSAPQRAAVRPAYPSAADLPAASPALPSELMTASQQLQQSRGEEGATAGAAREAGGPGGEVPEPRRRRVHAPPSVQIPPSSPAVRPAGDSGGHTPSSMSLNESCDDPAFAREGSAGSGDVSGEFAGAGRRVSAGSGDISGDFSISQPDPLYWMTVLGHFEDADVHQTGIVTEFTG